MKGAPLDRPVPEVYPPIKYRAGASVRYISLLSSGRTTHRTGIVFNDVKCDATFMSVIYCGRYEAIRVDDVICMVEGK